MDPRPARADEVLAVADLWLRSRRASIPAIPAPVHDEADVKAWFAGVVFPTKEVWVIAPDERVAALMVLDGCWLDQLYVDPQCTDRGLGSRLVELAQQLRPDGLELWTFQSNTGARRFYERHGFEAVETTEGDNEEGAPDVRYSWPAGGARGGPTR